VKAKRVNGKLILCGQTWMAADGADGEQLRAACASWATDVRPPRVGGRLDRPDMRPSGAAECA